MHGTATDYFARLREQSTQELELLREVKHNKRERYMIRAEESLERGLCLKAEAELEEVRYLDDVVDAIDCILREREGSADA